MCEKNPDLITSIDLQQKMGEKLISIKSNNLFDDSTSIKCINFNKVKIVDFKSKTSKN